MNCRAIRCLSISMAGLAAAAVTILLAAPQPASGMLDSRAVVSWDGSCGNAFWASQCGSMTNWNNDQQTGLGDQVSIGPGDPVVNIVFDAQASSLTCESGLWIDAALELAGSGAIRDLTLSSIAQRALKINAGQVTLTGTTNWEQGRVGGAGVLRNESMMTGNMQMIDSTTFVNATQATMRGGSMDTNAVAINSQGALFTLKSPSVGSQITLSGPGMFVNHGNLEHWHLANSIIHMTCPYLQDTGNFDVNTTSAANASTHFQNSATFSGGEFTIAGDARVRFMDPGGVGAVYLFDGLQAVTGNGNLHFEIPFFGQEVKVTSDLNVNLTGTDGLVINSRYTTLGAELRNQGKCRLLGGTVREAPGSEGITIPQLSNESGATMRLNGSGIAMDTWLRNKSGGTIVHEFQGLQLGGNGLITNHGTYEHRSGQISRAAGDGTFSNYGTYVRPNHANTQNETVQVPFALNPGGIARFEKALTEFAFGIGSGTYFLGGNMDIWNNAMVRVAGGSCEQADSIISGGGQFHFGGYTGGIFPFVVDEDHFLSCNLGPDEAGDPVDGGAYLRQGGRIGGMGEVWNNGQWFWDGGSVGHNGSGTLVNSWDGDMTITSGSVNAGGNLINSGPPPFFRGSSEGIIPVGLVKQRGGLSITSGTISNFGNWVIETASGISGSAVHEFLNAGIGLFMHSTPVGQSSSVTAKFNNQGKVHVTSGSLSFSNVVQVTGTTLTGGRWVVDQGATLDLPGSLTTIGAGAQVTLNGAATLTDLATIQTLSGGTLNLNGSNWNRPAINVTNGGSLNFNTEWGPPNTINNGTGTGNCVLGYANTQVVPSLAGEGGAGPLPFALVCAAFNNSGTVRPGDVGAVGPFKMDGNFNQSSTGTLQIELGGTTPVDEHDQLIVDGNVVVDGYLNVRALPGFTPSIGQQFTIIAATNGTISGTFDQITGYGQYSLNYAPGAVTLTVVTPPVAGDVNNDGHVNVLDLLAVISGWGACPAQPAFCAVDLNGDGVVAVLDLLAVINNWD